MAAGADAAEKHAEFARKIFDYATKNTREIEEPANQSRRSRPNLPGAAEGAIR